jgi:hypothetical protein
MFSHLPIANRMQQSSSSSGGTDAVGGSDPAALRTLKHGRRERDARPRLILGWTEKEGPVTPDDGTVGLLQERMLESALCRTVLPGMTSPLSVPDLDLVRRAPRLTIWRQGYFGSSAIGDVELHLAEGSLSEAAGSAGTRVAFLRLDVPERAPGRVRLALEVVVPGPAQGQAPVPLSRTQVTFEDPGTGWRVVGPPTYVSS